MRRIPNGAFHIDTLYRDWWLQNEYPAARMHWDGDLGVRKISVQDKFARDA